MVRFVYLILMLILPNACASAAPPKTVKVCMMDSELFPLWRKPGQEDKINPGINIELQKQIMDAVKLQIEWVRAPFPRCLVMLRHNEVDLFNAASYSPDRELYGVYPKDNGQIDITKRLKTDSYYAYVRRKASLTWSSDNFVPSPSKPIAIEIGASIRSKLNDLNIPIYEVSRVEQAFGMLEKGRVSAVVTNQFNGYIYQSDDIIELNPAVQSKFYYLISSHQFNNEYPVLMRQIWSQSEQVRKESFKRLLDKYAGLTSWHEN
ncbi:hypothetical protein DRW07_11110 [Alteromonas sediminis]|uniref:Uncharacterized protein n=1 Tax=Alteromonas sediminis TaxID=2259342 RepID=A0A3N5Y121_9ALTE|nr:transporter substrate-binding domain-containing protein [Alteromonas sediminis]RPJ66623.1 hypothetical protein DRW07_11110 [Alteromonas sediminis]